MSFPPPPSNPNAPGPQNSGGFGPPQGGFGPPETPGGYDPGSGAPGAPGGYGYPGPPGGANDAGGYGYPGAPGGPGGPGVPPGGPPGGPFPPPDGGGGGGNGAKVAGIIIAAVVVGAMIVGGVLIFGGGDDKDGDKADDKPSASATSTESPNNSSGSPVEPEDSSPPSSPADVPSLDPKPSESDVEEVEVPYVVVKPGKCFDHPALSSEVTEVTEVPCNEPHNGEVITNRKITGTYGTEIALQNKVLEVCEADATKRLENVTPTAEYYYYAIYPALETYQRGTGDTISCSLTLSNELDGEKLTGPLPK